MYSQYFQAIIGHREIKNRLLRLLEKDRMPHAMIFAGPAGIGKTMMARAIASAMVGRPLFAHVHIDEKTDMPVIADKDDGYYLAPNGAMLKVDQFRQLQSHLVLQGKAGCKRICIIDHVETMNAEFANRMLKILEEPPTGVYFILITDQPALLLPTIVSRCAEILFEPVGDEEMLQGLVQLQGGEADRYTEAVAWGNGIVKTVLAYLQGNGAQGFKRALDFLHIMTTHACPYAKWLSVSGEYTDEESKEILHSLGLCFRDMAVLRSGADTSLLRLVPYKQDMLKVLPYWTDAGIFHMMKILEEGIEAITRHVNIRLVWDYVCIQCIAQKGGI